jgi:hypothetical protein
MNLLPADSSCGCSVFDPVPSNFVHVESPMT